MLQIGNPVCQRSDLKIFCCEGLEHENFLIFCRQKSKLIQAHQMYMQYKLPETQAIVIPPNSLSENLNRNVPLGHFANIFSTSFLRIKPSMELEQNATSTKRLFSKTFITRHTTVAGGAPWSASLRHKTTPRKWNCDHWGVPCKTESSWAADSGRDLVFWRPSRPETWGCLRWGLGS